MDNRLYEEREVEEFGGHFNWEAEDVDAEEDECDHGNATDADEHCPDCHKYIGEIEENRAEMDFVWIRDQAKLAARDFMRAN